MKPKGIKIITETMEKDVTFLVDVDPLFVSLVKHGENQKPFWVIKEETEKGGAGSGNFGHEGRPGEIGGSAEGGGGGGGGGGSDSYGGVKIGDNAERQITRFVEREVKEWSSLSPLEGGQEGVILLDHVKNAVEESVFAEKLQLMAGGKRGETSGKWVPTYNKLVMAVARDIYNKVKKGKTAEKGGEGSGHPRHDGREGERGGSKLYDGSNDWMRHGGAVGMKDRIINIGEVPMKFGILPEVTKGGSGSGNYGHEGRPGEVGGSGGGGEGGGEGGGGAVHTVRGSDGVSNYIEKHFPEKEWKRQSLVGSPKGGYQTMTNRETGEKVRIDWEHKGPKTAEVRVTKSMEGGEEMSMIIQSILLPKGMSFDQLVTQKGLEFLSDAENGNKKEFERYTRFEQMPVAKFDKDSLILTKIHESGVWIVGGKLLDAKSVEGALTLGAQKDLTLQNPMNQPIGQIAQEPIEITFGDVFQREMSSFMSIVYGVMSQSGRDGATRKADVLNALDAFGAFLSMSLDSLGEKAVKLNAPVFELGKQAEGGEEMFKTKEEFVAAVNEVLAPVMKEIETLKSVSKETDEEKKKRLDEEEKKRLAEEAAKKTVTPSVDLSALTQTVTDMGKSVLEIVKTVKELSEKTDKLGVQLVTDPAATHVEDVDGKGKVKETKSVFKGIFDRKMVASVQS